MSYSDNFNFEEFQLLTKFNNKKERSGRHIDTFYLDDPDMTENDRKELNRKNIEKMKASTKKQLISMESYFYDE